MKKLTGVIFVIAAGFILFLGYQCQKYVRQNEELQEKLIEKDKAIEACTVDMKRLQIQLAEISEIKEYETETGFIKKGGMYLIDGQSQLEKLARMIEEKEEIEPGVAAAEASYRLRRNLKKMDDWFSIGTEETPFCGTFDGDGYDISGKFPLCADWNKTESLFYIGESARLENLFIRNEMDMSCQAEVCIGVSDEKDCLKLEHNLAAFPDCRVWLRIGAWNLDMQAAATDLRERWERNRGEEGYYVSVYFYPMADEEKVEWKPGMQTAMTPFGMLAGEEWGKIIEEAAEQEEGYLRYIELQRIGGINCCIFQIEHPWKWGRCSVGYHILLEGEWEGTHVQEQHLYVPYEQEEEGKLGYRYENCVTEEDINFDGKNDLLIHEGCSGGTGGSWGNYRAFIWKEETGQFEYYPSFPHQLVSLEFDRQRVITRWRLGAGYQCVQEFGVVDGEYVCTRKLIWEDKSYDYNAETGERIYDGILSYYEMDELVETHVVPSWDSWDEVGQLYPDLDYWPRG